MTYFVIYTGEIPFFNAGWYYSRESALAVCEALFMHYKDKKVPASKANWRVVELTEKDPIFKAYGGTLFHTAASAFSIDVNQSPLPMLHLTKKGVRIIQVT